MAYSNSDHLINIVKALVSAVPTIGGTIASLISDYVPRTSQRSLEDMLAKFAEQLRKLESRLDVDAVNKDEFADLYKSCYIATARSTDELKHRAAANILANFFLGNADEEKLPFTALDHFVRCIETLSSAALTVLGAATSFVRTRNIQPDGNGCRRLVFDQLQQQVKDIDPDLLMGLCGELHTYNLLRIASQPTIVVGRFNNYPLEVTSLGWKFVIHVVEA